MWGLFLPTLGIARGQDGEIPQAGQGQTKAQGADQDRVTNHKSSGMVEVTGEKQIRKKTPWLMIGLGAATVVAAVLLLRKKKTDDADPPLHSTPPLQIDMVAIRGGTFQMGSESCEAQWYEQPVHTVTLSSFQIGKYEVTQGQWQALMGSNPSRYQKGDPYPVEQVSWNAVQTFISRLNQQTGKRYRLPTEAEWEYAARGGSTEDRYGNLDLSAWYSGNSGGTTHPVGGKQPNAYGLYDMLGNVWEWCQDWFGEYTASAGSNPTGPHDGMGRTDRGGGFETLATGVRVSNRSGYPPGNSYDYLGFRLAMDAE
jgi:formylglycine-generating enzyme required for sulfatase activity